MFKKVHEGGDLHHLPLRVTEELPVVLPAAAKPAAASAAGGHLQPPQKKQHHQFSFQLKQSFQFSTKQDIVEGAIQPIGVAKLALYSHLLIHISQPCPWLQAWSYLNEN